MANTESININEEVFDVAVQATDVAKPINKVMIGGAVVGGGLLVAAAVLGIRYFMKKKAMQAAAAADEEYVDVADADFAE